MRINKNRDFESMKTESYFSTESCNGQMPTNNYGMNMNGGFNTCPCSYNEMPGETMPGVVCPPIYECPKETIVNRYICHEVPQE